VRRRPSISIARFEGRQGNATLAAKSWRWPRHLPLGRGRGPLQASSADRSPPAAWCRRARSWHAWQADALRRLADSFADYASEEGRLLVRRGNSKRWAGLSRCCAMPSSVWKKRIARLARLTRLLRIFAVGLRFGLHEFIPRFARNPLLRLAARRSGEPPLGACARRSRPRPIYVSSARCCRRGRDLVPLDIADELRPAAGPVPPFPSALAVAEIEQGLGRKIEAVFATFEREPVASASIGRNALHAIIGHETQASRKRTPRRS